MIGSRFFSKPDANDRATVVIINRHLPRPSLLPLLHRLARVGRLKGGFFSCRRHPDRLPAHHDPYVHIWKTCEDVDGQDEYDGEVLGVRGE